MGKYRMRDNILWGLKGDESGEKNENNKKTSRFYQFTT